MEKQESGGSSRPDDQGFRRSIGKEKRADSDEQRQIERDSCGQHKIVNPFLAIPGNGLILMAHGVAPEGRGCVVGFRDMLAVGHE